MSFLWPLKPKAPAFVLSTPIVNTMWKSNGYFAMPLLGYAGSWREWLLTLPLATYVLRGVGAIFVVAVRG